MGYTAENVKKWRRRTKARIIESMGGSCVCCGYDRCQSALALHHLNPSEKDFSFAAFRAVAKRWPLVVQELRKCVLICHNCHMEIHEGLRSLPKKPACFNEEYADYKSFERQNGMKLWPNCLCGRRMKPSLKHCSVICARQSAEKIRWNVSKLREMRDKGLSKRKIGVVLGVSDKIVARRLKRYDIA